MSMFDWIELEDGRARFAGGIRGWDEQGHQTFSVQVEHAAFFGEIEQVVVGAPCDFNLDVVSFGYRERDDVGLPASARERFSLPEAERVQRLVQELIAAAAPWLEKPFLLQPFEEARFLGVIAFRDGWINTTETA